MSVWLNSALLLGEPAYYDLVGTALRPVSVGVVFNELLDGVDETVPMISSSSVGSTTATKWTGEMARTFGPALALEHPHDEHARDGSNG